MDPLVGHDFELDAAVVFAGTVASRSHCVLALLSLPRDDEVEDPGSSGEVEQVHVSVLSLLELDGLFLTAFGSAVRCELLDLAEELDEGSRSLGKQSFHKPVDKPGTAGLLLRVVDVLWRELLLPGSTYLLFLR